MKGVSPGITGHQTARARNGFAKSWRATAVFVVLMMGLPMSPVDPAGTGTVKQRREEVRQARAAAATEVDVLQASRAEVETALDALEADAAAEQALLADTNRRVEQAGAEAAAARDEEQRIGQEVDALRTRLQAIALDEFVGGAGAVDDTTVVLNARDMSEAGKVVYLAGLEVERQDEVAGQLDLAREDLATQRRAAEDAEARLLDERAEAVIRVGEVERARAAQALFVSQVEAELERTLAEAAALEQLDAELAAQIIRKEQELATRLAAEATAAARTSEAAQRAAASRITSSAEAPSSVPVGGGLISVGGIVVHSSIAASLEELLSAAAADGRSFSGGGFRDPASQRRLREQNCPDPVRSPASSCSPATARVGQSNHEDGLAIDFTDDGQTITSQDSPGYRWLDANAARFELRNLPGEPWHWSTTGT